MGFRFEDWGLGLRDQDLGRGDWGFRFKDWALGLRH